MSTSIQDAYSLAVVKLGSGSNLLGYYMYHGGTNPEGKLTTLNENQRTPGTYNNDLPVMTYDFQARWASSDSAIHTTSPCASCTSSCKTMATFSPQWTLTSPFRRTGEGRRQVVALVVPHRRHMRLRLRQQL